MNGSQLPLLQTAVPGPSVAAWMERLAAVECPAITARRSGRAAAGATDPILWAEARGANVLDTDGNRFVDLTAGFGVAAVGHAHPKVVETINRAGSPIEYQDAPEFQAYWDADAKLMTEAVRKIGKVE